VHGVRLALRDVDFVDGGLAHVLLAHELKRSVDRTFRSTGGSCAHGPGQGPPRQSPWITRDPMGAPPPSPRRRGITAGCAVWTGLCCTGQVCCRNPYEDPWTGEDREGWCHKCDDIDCCDGCDCSCCDCDGCCCDCGCDC
jgi:hypothetical protein